MLRAGARVVAACGGGVRCLRVLRFSSSASSVPSRWVVLGYTGIPSLEAALETFAHPVVSPPHFLIARSGRVYHTLALTARSSFFGSSLVWAEHGNVAASSLAVALDNAGHEYGYTAYTDEQYVACAALLTTLRASLALQEHSVLGVSDVAPLKRWSPGERFDWRRIVETGIVTPVPDVSTSTDSVDVMEPGSTSENVRELQALLRSVGYRTSSLNMAGVYDAVTGGLVRAFHSRYVPRLVEAPASRSTLDALRAVAQSLQRTPVS